MAEEEPKKKRRSHPCRDLSYERTFVLQGPTLWLLSDALVAFLPVARGMKATDKERLDNLSKMFHQACVYEDKPVHCFDHRRRKAR